MRAWLITALLMAVALSGCADSGDAPEQLPVDENTEETSEVDGNETVEETTETTEETAENTTEEAENLVPILTVTADVVNGTAPLLVNFTIEVEDDSENLTWAFLIDGNETLTGTDFPAMFNHTFDAGNYTAGFTVTDGEHVVEDARSIVALAAAVAGPAQTETGEFVGVVSGCDNTVGVLGLPGLLGEENERFDLEPSTAGGTFTMDFVSEGPAVRYYVVYYGDGGAGVGGARPSDEPSYSGDIPGAATYFRVGVCAGGPTSFTYEGFAPEA